MSEQDADATHREQSDGGTSRENDLPSWFDMYYWCRQDGLSMWDAIKIATINHIMVYERDDVPPWAQRDQS